VFFIELGDKDKKNEYEKKSIKGGRFKPGKSMYLLQLYFYLHADFCYSNAINVKELF